MSLTGSIGTLAATKYSELSSYYIKEENRDERCNSSGILWIGYSSPQSKEK